MIECEQFIHGTFKGTGYRLIKSPDVDKWISEKSLQYLLRLDGMEPAQTLLPNGVIAITYFDTVMDEMRRAGHWNHTILLWAWDYFKLHPPDLFMPHFMKPTEDPPKTLKPIKIEEKECLKPLL